MPLLHSFTWVKCQGCQLRLRSKCCSKFYNVWAKLGAQSVATNSTTANSQVRFEFRCVPHVLSTANPPGSRRAGRQSSGCAGCDQCWREWGGWSVHTWPGCLDSTGHRSALERSSSCYCLQPQLPRWRTVGRCLFHTPPTHRSQQNNTRRLLSTKYTR